MLKVKKCFIVYIGILVIFLAGCSNGNLNEVENVRNENEIIVQKRVSEEDQYEHFKEINNEDTVEYVKDILNSINWENAKVSMAFPPHYKFHFNERNSQLDSNKLIYDLWISPNKDKVELVIEGESKYVQLTESKSAELFEAITGEKLSE